MIAAEEDLEGALADHLTDVRAAIHDDDVAALYVEVFGAAAPSARCSPSARCEAEREHSFRAATPVSAARSLGEAEPRAREAAALRLPDGRRLRAPAARPSAPATRSTGSRRRCSSDAAPRARRGRRGPLRRGLDPGGLHRPGPEARGDSRTGGSCTAAAPRRRRRPAAGSPASAISPSASTSSTRTTASPASPASTPAPSPGSPATTSTSPTATATRSWSRPSSSRRSPATSAAATRPSSRSSAASAGAT